MKETSSGLIAVERTVKVLKTLETGERPNLTEVARRARLNEATALRYLNTLTALNLVERVDGRRYRLGWEFFRLGQRALAEHVPHDAIRPAMSDLLEKYNETVNFAWRKDDSVVLIDVLEGNRAVKKVSDVGQVDHWHASALGKALLITMSDDERERVLEGRAMPRLTRRTLTSVDGLLANVQRAGEDGFAVDDEEADEDLTCIAAPVLKPGSASDYALSVSFVTHRLAPETLMTVGGEVRAAAARIAARLY